MLLFEDLAESEIDNFEKRIRLFGGEQEVLGLEVSVTDPVFVAITNALDNLLEDQSGLILRKVPLTDDPIEELSSAADLEYQVDLSLVLVGVE